MKQQQICANSLREKNIDNGDGKYCIGKRGDEYKTYFVVEK